jgi:hypothetical protein
MEVGTLAPADRVRSSGIVVTPYSGLNDGRPASSPSSRRIMKLTCGNFSSAVQRRESPICFAFCKFAYGTFQRSAAPILG